MLYLALGILGATVMPHNLYLHSAIVQTRAYGDTLPEKREALKYATIDSHRGADVRAADQRLDPDPGGGDLPHDRHRPTSPSSARRMQLLAPLLGSAIAPTLFGIALLCCGLNSTVTATLAGQAVMEGLPRHPRCRPGCAGWSRAAIAIIPAAGVTIFYGAGGNRRSC